MKLRNIVLIVLGILVAILYLIIANSVKNTELIWILTRTFGLLAFLSLFLLVLIGELKLLNIPSTFKLHCPAGILTLAFAFLHFLSAVFDKFKWGKNLNFSDYLGFTFSDRWLTLLSLGTLAFYLIILISITSSNKGIKTLGFKKWKLSHYLSYAVFILVFIHSLLLGTDLKTSPLRNFIFPIYIFMSSLLVFLFILRLLRKYIEEKDLFVLIILGILLAASVTYFANGLRLSNENKTAQTNQEALSEITALEKQNAYYLNYSQYLIQEINKHQDNSIELSKNLSSSAPIIIYRDRYIYLEGGDDD